MIMHSKWYRIVEKTIVQYQESSWLPEFFIQHSGQKKNLFLFS